MQVEENEKPRLFVHSPISGRKFSSKLNWNQLNSAGFALTIGEDIAKGVIYLVNTGTFAFSKKAYFSLRT